MLMNVLPDQIEFSDKGKEATMYITINKRGYYDLLKVNNRRI